MTAQEPPRFVIVDGAGGQWLAEEVGYHTCGTDRGGYYGAHEPWCGLEPIGLITDIVTRAAYPLSSPPAGPSTPTLDPSVTGKGGLAVASRTGTDPAGGATTDGPVDAAEADIERRIDAAEEELGVKLHTLQRLWAAASLRGERVVTARGRRAGWTTTQQVVELAMRADPE